MIVNRAVIAEVCGVNEQEVRCSTCKHSVLFINDAYTCKWWGRVNGYLPSDAFCPFWEKKEVQ